MPSLVEIGPVVKEKKMKMWKVYRQTDGRTDGQTDDERQVIRKAHLSFQLRWAKKTQTWNKCKSQFKQSYRNKNIRNKPLFLLHSSYKYIPACFYCIQQKTIYNYAVFDTLLHKLYSHSGNRVLFLQWIYIERQFKTFFSENNTHYLRSISAHIMIYYYKEHNSR